MIQIEESNPSFESCDKCIHSDDSEEACIIRRCIHAIAQLEECYVPKHRKKGTWEMVSQLEIPPTYIYSCSECRHKSYGFYRYCPNCGARMEEGEQDEAD